MKTPDMSNVKWNQAMADPNVRAHYERVGKKAGRQPFRILFEAMTPLEFRVRVTHAYWKLIVDAKNPTMAGREKAIGLEKLNFTEAQATGALRVALETVST